MSTFVGNMLDTIGQPRGNEGAINVLRKSYVSSEMDKAGARMTAEERQALAFHMRHSVNTSYKLNKCGVFVEPKSGVIKSGHSHPILHQILHPIFPQKPPNTLGW